MQRKALIAFAVIGVALLAAPLANAGQDPNWEGWWVELDTAFVTPGNVNTPLLNSGVSDSASNLSSNVSNRVDYTDFGSDPSFQIAFGRSWGSKGAIKVSYWQYSADETFNGKANAYYYGGSNYNWFTIGPTSAWGYSFYYPMEYKFTQELDASTFDVEYIKSHGMDDLTISWSVGARYASFEDEVEGSYRLDEDGTIYRFAASRDIDGDGFGFTAGIGADYGFTEHFGIGSKLRVGFLTVSVDSMHEITDVDGWYASSGVTWSESNTHDDQVSTTLDFNFSLMFPINDHFQVDAGYFYSNWTGLPESRLSQVDMNTDDQAAPKISDESRDRFAWSGPRVRLVWKF